MADIPQWHVAGDWFDVCKCNVPVSLRVRPGSDVRRREGILVWHVNEGNYGDVSLDGLNVLALGTFEGNIWRGESSVTVAMFLDDRADEQQLEALQTVFGGQAGGWPADFAKLIGEIRGMETAPIEFEIAADLASWRAEIPGKASAVAEALTGPTTPEGERVQTLNPPGSEVGPGGVATWGVATRDRADAFGFSWDRTGQSSKHIPFDWSGPG
jgi:hypothetical protein